MRQHPRFVTHEQIWLEVSGRNELRRVWMSDISKGGLFVETAEAPELRSRVRVSIRAPEGELTLHAEVVHRVPSGDGFTGGVGLQFVDLTPNRREDIRRYVEGLAEQLVDTSDLDGMSESDVLELSARMQTFLQGFEAESLYEGLGLDPTCSAAEVNERLEALATLFGAPERYLPPALAARLVHARTLLARIGALMRNPQRRCDYDFRHGHIHPERRISEAGSPERVAELRHTWRQIFQVRVRTAERLTAAAVRAANKLDIEGALANGEKALIDDPFNLELRDAVRDWRTRLERRNSRRPIKRSA